jgi:hypothetical protein
LARLAALSVLVTLVVTFAPTDSTMASTSSRRVDGHGLATGVAGVVDREPVVFRRIASSGARFVHLFVSWGSIAPRHEPSVWQPEEPSDPNYDWHSVDVGVLEAARAGLEPVLMVYGAPVWAQRCVGGELKWNPVCDPDPSTLAAFATAAARRYSGQFAGLPRVRYWQGLNEPNLSLFFNPQFADGRPASPDLYRELINSFYFAVKSVKRSNLVIAAGLGPISRPPWTIGPMEFARRLLCMRGRARPHTTPGTCEGGVHFDIFDIHPYTTGAPTHRGRVDDVQLGDLKKLTKLLAAADRAGRIKGRFRRTPLWITEFSWDSKPPDPGGLKMAVVTRWTAEALYRAWLAGVSNFFWYPLRDELTRGSPFSETIQGGLFFRGETVAQDRPKKMLDAFRFPFVAFSQKNGFSYWGRTPSSKPGRVLVQIRQGGSWRNAVVARADKHGIFNGVVRGSYGRNRRGVVRARYRRDRAIPFSLKPVRDFYQPPFG